MASLYAGGPLLQSAQSRAQREKELSLHTSGARVALPPRTAAVGGAQASESKRPEQGQDSAGGPGTRAMNLRMRLERATTAEFILPPRTAPAPPPASARISHEPAHPPPLPAPPSVVRLSRAWGTALALSVLRDMEGMLLYGGHATGAATDRLRFTPVDRALDWMAQAGAADAELATLLEVREEDAAKKGCGRRCFGKAAARKKKRGETGKGKEAAKETEEEEEEVPEAAAKDGWLYGQAARVVERWQKRQEEAVEAVCKSQLRRGPQLDVSQIQRVATNVYHVTRVRHMTVSCVTAPVGVAMRRWQKALVTFTLVLVAVFSTVYVTELRSESCCHDARLRLGCDVDPNTPCRGFDLNCGSLPDVFAGVQYSGFADYACHTFPDPDNAIHGYMVGFMASSVITPVTVILETLAEWCNEAPLRFKWVLFAGPVAWLLGANAHQRWRWLATEASARWTVLYVISQPLLNTAIRSLIATMLNAWDRLRERVRGPGRRRAPPVSAAEVARAARKLERDPVADAPLPALAALVPASLRWAAGLDLSDVTDTHRLLPARHMVVVFLVTIAAVWVALVAGTVWLSLNVLDLQGQAAFNLLFYGWFASFVSDQVAQWKDVYQELFQDVVYMVGAERLGRRPAEEWWPEALDYMSAQASLLRRGGGGENAPQRLRGQVLSLWRYRVQIEEAK